jgi:hypothetical protein
MKIIGGTDKDKEDEARKRADALAKATSKMLPQHLSHGELLAALSSVLAAASMQKARRRRRRVVKQSLSNPPQL